MPVMDDRWQALRISQEPMILMAQSGVKVSHTGNATETTLATVNIPGGTIGPNGQIEVELLFSCTNSANTKTARVRFGGSTALSMAVTTVGSQQTRVRIANRNAQNSQVLFAISSSYTTSGNAPGTLAIDTSADTTLTITGQLVTTTETISIESYIVRVFPGA